MKNYSLFLALFFFTSTGAAQSVDFDVPTEINIIQGRLSVAFYDHIKEHTADDFIRSLGYSVLQSTFDARHARTTSDKSLSVNEINALENDARVIEVQQRALPDHLQTTKPQRNLPRFHVTVSFLSHITEKEAKEILQEMTSIEFTFPQKRPNEIVIDVGDQDEAAFSMLEGRDEVRWVTYVGVAGDNN